MLIDSDIKQIIGYLEPGEQGGRDLKEACGILRSDGNLS